MKPHGCKRMEQMFVIEIQPVELGAGRPTHAGSLGVCYVFWFSGAFLSDHVRGSECTARTCWLVAQVFGLECLASLL